MLVFSKNDAPSLACCVPHALLGGEEVSGEDVSVTDDLARTTLIDMRPSEALSLHRERIREIVLSHRMSGVRVFGSAMRGDDSIGSDLDLLVDPLPQTTLLDVGAIRHELKNLLGLEVDVLTPNGLPAKFRDQVLREAVPL